MKKFQSTSVYYNYEHFQNSMEALKELGEKGWSIKTSHPIDSRNSIIFLEKEILD